MTDDLLLVGSSGELEEPEDVAEWGDAPRLRVPGVAVVDTRLGRVVHQVSLPHPPGEMLPVGTDDVVTFYGHPRRYRLADGELLEEWPQLDTGPYAGSIRHHLPKPPPVVVDIPGRRFAVADDEGIVVVEVT